MKRALLAVALVILLLLGGLYAGLQASLPDSGQFSVAGLQQSTEIRFDSAARPYVRAQSMADALAAQGWLHARHRLWQMELYRRAGTGRLAELLGASMLDADEELWRIGVPELAARLARNARKDTRELIEAYVAGINAALAQQSVAPPEFLLLQSTPMPWTVEDVFAVGALTAYQSANNYTRELFRLALREKFDDAAFELFLDDQADASSYPLVMPRPGAALAHLQRAGASDPDRNPMMPRLAFGSNGWVVAPGKAAGDAALFAFDSHDSLGLPNLFYEVHLFFPAGQIRGWSAPGLPGVINGYNEAIAWGFTNIGDTQDVFLEQPHPEGGHHYKDGDSWYLAQTRQINIPVRDGDPRRVELVNTRNGRLVSLDPPMALRWTAMEREDIQLDSLFELNRATDWDSFNAALDDFPAPTLNATWADVRGNIGFRTAGLLPRRGAGEGLYPLPGDEPANRWQGLVAAEDMPRRFNPPEGFLAAANARVNPPGASVLVSADNAAPYRIDRIQSVLRAGQKLTLSDMAQLQTDWFDPQAQRFLPGMLAALEGADLEPLSQEAVSLLQAWSTEPVAAPDSSAALIFQHWYIALAREVFAQKLGPELMQELLKQGYLLNQGLDSLLNRADDPIWWRGGKSTMLATALAQSLSDLAGQMGTSALSDWRLDDLQQVTLKHELGSAVPGLAMLFNDGPHPLGGTPAAVGRANYRYTVPNKVTHGATVRVIARMDGVPEARAIIPGGQSGHPLSPHYVDQFALWRRGEYLPISPSPEAVSGTAVRLEPAAQ